MYAQTAELHLWQARLDSGRWPSADLLPGEERDRAAKMRRPDARRRWVAARWALRGVLGRYLEQDPAAVELRVGRHGKPGLAGSGAPLHFNLSHSGERALVAVGRGRPVGVDIERIEPRRDVLALARIALDPAQARSIAEAPARARPAAFHAAWTRREAIAKCLGVGLGAALPEDAVAVSNLDVGPDFAAAIAVAGDEVPAPRRYVIDPVSFRRRPAENLRRGSTRPHRQRQTVAPCPAST